MSVNRFQQSVLWLLMEHGAMAGSDLHKTIERPKTSSPGFYFLMSRLIDNGLVTEEVRPTLIDGYTLYIRWFHITDKGKVVCERDRKPETKPLTKTRKSTTA